MTVMQVIAFAFPRLNRARLGKTRLAALSGKLKPAVEEHLDILIEARRISRRLKKILGR